MKFTSQEQIEKLHTPPVITPADWAMTLAPALAWAGLVHARAHFISPHCIHEPLKCVAENLLEMDRASLGMAYPLADSLSFQTQYAAGWFALLVPVFWTLWQNLEGKLKGVPTWKIILIDGFLLLQTTLWNGLLTEAIRITIQRPRPFVYLDPARLGNNPAHYTSFVSGHTSFAAAASTALLFILLSRRAPSWLVILAGASGALLTVCTGLFRVLAGRHFATDVIFALLAGMLAAYGVARIHRPASRTV